MSDASDELRSAIISDPETRALLRTDGDGRVLSAGNIDAREAAELAVRVDLALAAVRALGAARELGAPSTVVLDYEGAVMIAGVDRRGENIIVVASPGARVGLMLSRVRRLLAASSGEELS